MNTYRRLPVAFSHGEGAWLIDTQGKRYLDAHSGVAVNALGHAHPDLVDALTGQMSRMIHVSNHYHILEQEQAAIELARLSKMDRFFFGNSGAEANEGLIKLSRLHARQKGIENPVIIVMEGSFHGRTMATLSATGNTKIQAGFDPLLPGFLKIPFNDIEALAATVSKEPNIVAVLLETVQGEGGVKVGNTDYLKAVRQLCDEKQWLLLIDEIQTGIGRTGTWFGYQQADILPDAISLAKGLGGGIPIGAIGARGTVAEYFEPGQHGSTFGGNPLATTAAKATLGVIEKYDLVENAAARGKQIIETLKRSLDGRKEIVDIRGRGLLIGIELDRPCSEIVMLGLEAGLLLNVTAERVIRLMPPLIITEEEADQMAKTVCQLINTFYATQTG